MSSQPSTAPPTVPAGSTATRRGGAPIVITWIVTRAIMLVLIATVEQVATGDVTYYWRKIAALGEVGLGQTLNEYPTPVAWLLAIPYGLGAGTHRGYLIAFIGLMMLLDAAFAWALWRTAGRRRDAGLTFWVWFVFLMGPLCYLRFDLVPAVLAGTAILACRRQPWLTGALTGVAAAIKLWPALLILPFTAVRRGRRATILGFLVAGLGLAVISLIAGGLPRLVSPLTWQSDRGLQIESIWSTALMVLRVPRPGTWVVGMSRYQAFEVFGPGVGSWLVISTIATLLGLMMMAALYARGYRTPQPTSGTIGVVILATVAIMIVTNKTLSPQYLVWLGGPMAALLIMRARDVNGRMTVFGRFAIQLLVLALITHLVYPLTYSGLYGAPHGTLFVVSTILLLVRNVSLLVFTIAVTAVAWRSTESAPGPERARLHRAVVTGLVVGADVGGTSTRVAVADLDGTVLGVGREAGGNPNAVGLASSAARIRTATELALDCAARPAREVAAMVFGMAGYNTAIAAGAEFLHDSLVPEITVRPRIVSDLGVAYASGSPLPRGYVVIAGTGSGAAEIDRGEIVARRGAWGWLLGDEGAGFWLGREAVRQALAEAERGAVRSPLGRLVIDQLGIDPERALDGLLRIPYEQSPITLARLAPLVSDLVDSDPAAAAIAARAAESLAGLVLDLDPRPGRPVVVTGSVLQADPIRRAFAERILAATPSPVAVATSGLVGALWLALGDLGQPPDPDLHGRLTATLAEVLAEGPGRRPNGGSGRSS